MGIDITRIFPTVFDLTNATAQTQTQSLPQARNVQVSWSTVMRIFN